jgi:hypothetical protein
MPGAHGESVADQVEPSITAATVWVETAPSVHHDTEIASALPENVPESATVSPVSSPDATGSSSDGAEEAT